MQRSTDMQDDKHRFKQQIDKFRVAMFVTQHEGLLRARPMAIADTDNDGTIWFVSPLATAKVDDVLDDAHAAITVQNATTFVSVSGTCRVIHDADMIAHLRSEPVDAWMGDATHTCVAIEFKPVEAEFWSQEHKGLRFLFDAARAAVTGGTAMPGRVDAHSRISLGAESRAS